MLVGMGRHPPTPEIRAAEAPVKTSRARLQWGLLGTLALALALHGALFYTAVRERIRADADQFVMDKARLLSRAVNTQNVAFVAFHERDWRNDRLTPYAQTFDLDWNPGFVSSRLPGPIALSEDVRRHASHPLGMLVHDAADASGTRYRAATFTVVRDGTMWGYAQVAVRHAERDAPLRRLRGWLVAGSLTVLGLAAVGLRLVLRQWQLQLVTFAETARRIAMEGVARHRFVPPPDSPELVELARTFNLLLDRQATLQESQQQFIADAAHELRTPLTVLRGELEVALRRDRSTPEYQETLTSCREEIERLSRLAENLLALARLDSGAQLELRQALDLGIVCRDAAERLEPRAREQGTPIDVQAGDALPVLGDRLALERVLFNLLDNGLRYSPRGETLELRAFLADNRAVVEVTDHGPGIPAESLPRVFDRFYRVEPGRPRERGGAGLGLAIVQALVTAHGGSVEVRSQLGHGSTFTVKLPLAATTGDLRFVGP